MAKEISIGVKLITDLKEFITGFRQAQNTSAQFGESIEKKISVPLNKLEGQLRTLRAAQRRSLSPEDYARIGDEIKKVQGEIDRFKGKSNQAGGIISDMVTTAKGLLPAFSFAAIGAGAVYAFNKIKNSTDTLATDWEATMNGMNEGLNEFWRTIASGDWSNFTDRMREAISIGREYTYALDDIEDRTRSLRIVEANASDEKLRLEEMLRNVGISPEERLKAGQDRIKLEEDLSDKRKTIAQDIYNAEVKLTAAQVKLSEERLQQIIGDLDSESKVKAKLFNEQLNQYEKLKKANVSVSFDRFGNAVVNQLADTEEMKALKWVIDGTKEGIRLYAEQIRQTGRTTDEQLEKMVVAYENLKGAENSAAENTKRVRTQVNSLIAQTNKELQKEWDTRQKLAKIAAEKAAPKLAPITNQKQAGQFATIAPDTSQLDNMEGYLDRVSEKTKKFTKDLQTLSEEQRAVVESVSGGFAEIGQSVINSMGLASDGFGGFLKTMLEGTVQLLSMLLANAMGNAIAGASNAALFTGPGAVVSLPVFIATAIGSILSAFAAIPKFATGGVVGGTSFVGDKVLARVNSGEEILTASDPRHRNNLGSNSGTQISIINEAVIRGDDLYILTKKAERRINKRT